MRFQIPQFIEIESKIFGPLTLKQFIFLVGGAGIIFIIWNFLPFFLAILLAVPIAGLALALSFYKVNNQPFVKILEKAFGYFGSSKVYIWSKSKAKKITKKEEKNPETPIYIPKLTESKLKDLSWSLNIKEKIK